MVSGVRRPHFGGRNPPFLVATLAVGLCVLGVSYWRLGLQYNDLEEQLKRLIQKKDSLEANENFISKQLELREENFSEAKVSLQKKEQEVADLKKRLDQEDAQLKDIRGSLDTLKKTNDQLKSDLTAKEASLKEAQERNKVLEAENVKLKADLKELKTKMEATVVKVAPPLPALKPINQTVVKSSADTKNLNNNNNNNPNIPAPPQSESKVFGDQADRNEIDLDDPNNANSKLDEPAGGEKLKDTLNFDERDQNPLIDQNLSDQVL